MDPVYRYAPTASGTWTREKADIRRLFVAGDDLDPRGALTFVRRPDGLMAAETFDAKGRSTGLWENVVPPPRHILARSSDPSSAVT